MQSNLWLAKMVAPDMAQAGGGSMMFTSSIGAFKPSEMLGTYGMYKLALIGLVKNASAMTSRCADWVNPMISKVLPCSWHRTQAAT